MKLTHYIYISTALALLTACSDDDLSQRGFTVGEADNAIVLQAGVVDGGKTVQTRALANPDGNHPSDPTKGGGHKLLTTDTYARLRVDGKWKKTDAGSAEDVRKATTIQLGGAAATSGNDLLHNIITSYSPQLYWDDYGTADPANATEGRTRGLTIYGVAIDDYKESNVSALPTLLNLDNTQANWTSLTWTLEPDQKTSGFKNQDLLISNNVVYNADETKDNAYKFADRANGKLIEFTHAMSKITFILTPGNGFPASSLDPGAPNKFESTPEVILSSRKTGDNTTLEWAQTKGIVNVETGEVTLATEPVTSSFTMHYAETDAETQKVTLEALVFPKSEFKDKGANAEDPYPTIARINADGNIYYVTSEKIRTAIHEAGYTDYLTQPGKNYVIKVKVNKTDIQITATVTDWINIAAEEVEPVINVSSAVGSKGTGTDALTAFDFYMREQESTNYTAYGSATGTADGSTKWTFKTSDDQTTTLYWPTHNTHYHMRAVSPKSTVLDEDKTYIAVANNAYDSSISPSNLMIGMPEIAEADKMCQNSDHTSVNMIENGICARNNTINLNFTYVMSQVEVRLKSSGTDVLGNKVTFDENTKVEILKGYEKARIMLDSRTHDGYRDADKVTEGKYAMHASRAEVSGFSKIFHDIIVPQQITDDMIIRITVTNSNGTTDAYEKQLNEIKVYTTDNSGALITEWEPGKHYIYSLDVKKTEIVITATLTDWVTVEAADNIWF